MSEIDFKKINKRAKHLAQEVAAHKTWCSCYDEPKQRRLEDI